MKKLNLCEMPSDKNTYVHTYVRNMHVYKLLALLEVTDE
jgi:hypothetical protein